MTRLEQALRWWANHDGGPIPQRHVVALTRAEFLGTENEDGERNLNDAGQRALRAQEEKG